MADFLAVDTSSRYLTVLAKKGDKTVIRHIGDCAMQHSVILMGEIESALEEAGLTPDGCDYFAAVTGPGSFTGIRIGVATIKPFPYPPRHPLRFPNPPAFLFPPFPPATGSQPRLPVKFQ